MLFIEEEICNGNIKHGLKIKPEFFNEVLSERKKFEIRKNDRQFKAGDLFALMEFENGCYTGRYFVGCIGYVLQNCQEYGLLDGYCIFSW